VTINWLEFTPLMSFVGGVFIGGAALMLMLTKGRVMGISGIVSGLLPPSASSELFWRLGFLIGVVAAPVFLVAFDMITVNAVHVAQGGLFYLAALLVGVGTAIGSGCTSGHGICGLARLSVRSIVAVCVFVGSGMVTVFILRHLL